MKIKQRNSVYFQDGIKILKQINDWGYKAYFVGGAVRDLLLNRPVNDIDICTNCPVDKLKKDMDGYSIGISENFGIVVIPTANTAIEVAHFRSDGKYKDGRRPTTVNTDVTLMDDLQRRDFTINGLVMDKDWRIHDHVDGISDLRKEVIRTIGDPKDRFSEDYLRILRAIRFAAQLDFVLSVDTHRAIKSMGSKLLEVHKERITEEIWKMACTGKSLARGIRLLDANGLLKQTLPFIHDLRGLPQLKRWHPEGDVYQHTLCALEKFNSYNPLCNMAILLHDIGKAIETEEHTYYTHDKKGAELIEEEVPKYLRMSNKQKDVFKFCCSQHMRVRKVQKRSKIVKLVKAPYWDILRKVSTADALARGEDNSQRFDNMEAKAEKWVPNNKPLVSGGLIMDICGIKEGPKVGEIQDMMEEWVINNDVEDEERIKEKLLDIKRKRYNLPTKEE